MPSLKPEEASLVSANHVRLLGPVDTEEKLRRQEVPAVLHAVWRGVVVVVPSFPVGAEAVCVLRA